MLFHIVYKTTNKITSKYYVGVHSTNDLNDGYLGSGHSLKRAILKYGKDNFERQIIAMFNERDEALYFEKSVVTKELVCDPNCYNSIVGGNCPPQQQSEFLVKNKLKGTERTEAQKKASLLHSSKMKNKTPHNKKKIKLFGEEFDSVTQALKFFKLSPSHYYFMQKSNVHFSTAEELKKYTWKIRNEKISKSRRQLINE